MVYPECLLCIYLTKSEFGFCYTCTAKSFFIPIEKLELPTKSSQFRRVNEEFVKSLQAEMETNPAGSYGALFVNVGTKELKDRCDWRVEDKDSYTYEVLGVV